MPDCKAQHYYVETVDNVDGWTDRQISKDRRRCTQERKKLWKKTDCLSNGQMETHPKKMLRRVRETGKDKWRNWRNKHKSLEENTV